jgi:hypothetical protein
MVLNVEFPPAVATLPPEPTVTVYSVPAVTDKAVPVLKPPAPPPPEAKFELPAPPPTTK